MTAPDPALLDALVSFSRDVGDPVRDWVILAEGNTSLLEPGGDRMLVKATGSQLRTAAREDFVSVDLGVYRALLERSEAGDEDVAGAFAEATVWGPGRPSVESLLHAVCYDVPGVTAVAHTHATPVLTLMASSRAEALVGEALFPDQIVVLGRHPLLVPYVDPGLPLARHVRRALLAHVDRHGAPPRVIYLRNHGLFALGTSPEDAVGITEMAVKVARITLGALAVGDVVPLEGTHADRIDTRPDEALRRRILAERSRH